jgi:hypothetical protein
MVPNSNFTLGEFVLLGSLPNSNFTPGAFAHFGSSLGPFGVQGPKIKLYSGEFVLLWRLPNSNFTLGLLHILGPTGAFWGSGAQNQLLLWGICPFREALKIKLYSGAFAHFGAHWGILGMKFLRTVQSVSTNSWLSVMYLFSIIHRTPLTWHLRMGKSPQVKFECGTLTMGKSPRNQIWFCTLNPKMPQWAPKMGESPRSKILVWEPPQKDKCLRV